MRSIPNCFHVLLSFGICCCLVLLPLWAHPLRASENRLRELLREQVNGSRRNGQLACGGELICGVRLIPGFYERREYRPAWIIDGTPAPRAARLLSAIEAAYEDGFRPRDYHLDRLRCLMKTVAIAGKSGQAVAPELLRDLDVLLTDAFLLLGAHLSNGRVDPETIHVSWVADSSTVDLAGTLERALVTDDIAEALAALAPPHLGYRALKKARKQYQRFSETAEAAPVLTGGSSLKQGDTGPRVLALRDRLTLFGEYMGAAPPAPEHFDNALDAVVRRVQTRHGLMPDGVVGKRTRSVLNASLGDRLDQIDINMERWRWVPHEMGAPHILVNVADFSLRLVAGQDTLMEMRVVAGRPIRRTPVFSDRISYLVLNPYWHIPRSIAVQDILPKLKKDPGYLRDQHIRVFENWQKGAPEVSPESIDWATLPARRFPYKLRQDPGPQNALGRIKFMFPNKFKVYLHDTPARELFKLTKRGFSSGCIRIEKPVELAAYLLRDNPKWTREKLLAQFDTAQRRIITVRPKVPIHIFYWTAWVDDRGAVHFRGDIYGRDARLYKVLEETPPRPAVVNPETGGGPGR